VTDSDLLAAVADIALLASAAAATGGVSVVVVVVGPFTEAGWRRPQLRRSVRIAKT